MTITPLTADEAALNNFTHKIALTYADIILLTSGTAASIFPGYMEANTFPAGCYITDAMAVVKTAFTGGTGTLTFGVTDTSANAILAPGTTMTVAGTMAAYNLTKPVTYATAQQLLLTVTAGTSILGWTAGELDIYVMFIDVNILNR